MLKYSQLSPLLDILTHLGFLYQGNREMMRQHMYTTLREHLPHMDDACWERGCACYDDRVDGPKQAQTPKQTPKQAPKQSVGHRAHPQPDLHWQPENFRAPPQGWAREVSGPKPDPELVAKAVELWRKGHKYKDIAKMLNRNANTISNWIKKETGGQREE